METTMHPEATTTPSTEEDIKVHIQFPPLPCRTFSAFMFFLAMPDLVIARSKEEVNHPARRTTAHSAAIHDDGV